MEKAEDIVLFERSIPEIKSETTGGAMAESSILYVGAGSLAHQVAALLPRWHGWALRRSAGSVSRGLQLLQADVTDAACPAGWPQSCPALCADYTGAGSTHCCSLPAGLCGGCAQCAGLVAAAWAAATAHPVRVQCRGLWAVRGAVGG